MSSSLQSLADNLPEENVSLALSTYQSKTYKCFERKITYKKDFSRDLIMRFRNTYQFCNNDINKFIFLLKKGICLY